VGKSGPTGKPFKISKQAVWEAYLEVRRNDGAAGVDGQSVGEFEKDLRDNLYKIWNRMSSGTYFPPPVLAVEIPKPHGGGTRVLGVPTVADRIAQTVVARFLGARVDRMFHPDSYGYRPRKSALDAVAVCRARCWKRDWVLDVDVERFFDSVPWDLMVKAVEANTDQTWVVLYVKRWLGVPLQYRDGTVVRRDRGTPQGNTTQLSDHENLDMRCLGVACREVAGSFSVVGVNVCPLDDARSAAIPSRWIQPFQDLSASRVQGFLQARRGKNPPGW